MMYLQQSCKAFQGKLQSLIIQAMKAYLSPGSIQVEANAQTCFGYFVCANRQLKITKPV